MTIYIKNSCIYLLLNVVRHFLLLVFFKDPLRSFLLKEKKREKKKKRKKSLTSSLLRVCNSSAFNSVTNNIPVPSYTKLIHYPSFKKYWLKIH